MKMRMELRDRMAMMATAPAPRASWSTICAKPRAAAYLGFGHTVNHPHRPPQEASM